MDRLGRRTDEIDRLDAQMSNYKPQSELSSINRRAAREALVALSDYVASRTA